MYEIIQLECKAYFVLFIAHGRIIGRNKLFIFVVVVLFLHHLNAIRRIISTLETFNILIACLF